MASFLKNLFVQSEPEPTPAPAKAEIKREEKESKPVFIPKTESVSTEYVEILCKAMEDKRAKSFDFLKFKESVDSMQEMLPDEALRFKTAFATAKIMGITKQELEDSSTVYFKILDDEQGSFNQVLIQAENINVIQKEEQIKALEIQLEKRQQELLKLHQEIDEQKKSIYEQKNSVAIEIQRIKVEKERFEVSHQSLKNILTTYLEKIKVYL